MGAARRGAGAIAALAAIAGCAFDSSGAGEGVASVGETGDDDDDDGPTTASDPTTGADDDGPTTADDSGTDGGCPPGTNGCPCADDACDEGLVCTENGECVPATCGNGEVEGIEDCDDQNETPDDGCEDNCTISPGAAQVAAGAAHTCVRTWAGKVRCWGEGDLGATGQNGTDDIGDMLLPTAGMDLPIEAVRSIGLGAGFGCALGGNGSVACWGGNPKGQLGLGNAETAMLDEPGEQLVPLELPVIVEHLAVGRGHACVVHQGGAVRCWGEGGKGRLGYGGDDAMIGNDVGDDEIPGDLDPVEVGGQVDTLALGDEHTCALLTNGDVRCWGAHSEGRLGNPDITADVGLTDDPDEFPALDFDDLKVHAIFADGHHSCAIVGDDEQLWCWGNGALGRLGTGDTADVLEPTPIETGGRTVTVELGATHTCAQLTDVTFREVELDQVVRCWGDGASGRLGSMADDDLGGAPETTPDLIAPVDVLGGESRRIRAIAAGAAHTCVLTSGGAVRCWGEGDGGRLGYGSVDDIGDDEPPWMAGDVSF
jgi:cysteine-rich repeat protein